ncbi:histone acetylation protein-domain-containing protein [Xylogone sp. PMI_703]|nr:histone acetylation protein-domain-containing protein [Xylogone sp. PMI_703]
MAAKNIQISGDDAVSRTLIEELAPVLPWGFKFKIYHLSTPPTRTNAIYAPPPGARPDRTYCESHFLAVAINSSEEPNGAGSAEVLAFAIEVLIYSTASSTTIFVSKADSTGYLTLLKLPRGSPSPIRDISCTFLKYLVQERRRKNTRTVVSLFARAQDQYLFPGSIKNRGKHVLDDRGLVRWWCRVLDPLIIEPENQRDSHSEPTESQWNSVKGFLLVPGLDSYECRTFIPAKRNDSSAAAPWTVGHPLQDISTSGPGVPPRCLIPHFPDDPKARFLDELDEEISGTSKAQSTGQWRSVQSIEQFWEMMAFRQECSAGRLVGFIWIVFTPEIRIADEPSDDKIKKPPSREGGEHKDALDVSSSQRNENSGKPNSKSTKTKKKKKLTGPIIPREPRIKTENRNYLLDKPERTSYYIWRPRGRGQVIVDETDYKRITELLLHLEFSTLSLAVTNTQRWVNEVKSSHAWGTGDAWGQEVTGIKSVEVRADTNTGGVNVLNLAIVKKKRKGEEGENKDGSNSTTPANADNSPQVNVLGGSMIRKKAKV